ncbi:FdtA/QdtA family cupin domain-containing protein [Mucilaginibacter sp. JRF]|uniref:sugar 3,4-ketoisomerase n=1 Tax=Mucilaginibacter sp. JRF TaxID=2780088 RepID=UPI00187FCCDF|nr:FdtA/QdtA family cupin domain-containing protein [Mucilaginibacter sp. JRF]MBE9585141.1 FdtA/QdtA family cupin domain-containing protein [Mucilaginibacter sp. JRF]
MAHLLHVDTFTDDRGSLSVLDEVIPFPIKRLFYIYGVDNSSRGGHRHHTTRQAAICIKGSCTIRNHDGHKTEEFEMDSPSKCLILEPEDWHVMTNFSSDAILLVLASTRFDPHDYIFDPYATTS